MNLFESTVATISPLDEQAMATASTYIDSLLKPVGSLGVIEKNAIKLAGISGNLETDLTNKTIMVMCGDHGAAAKISSFPQAVSTLVAETMLSGISGVAVLAKHAGARLCVVDLGLVGEISNPAHINRKIALGTADFTEGPAMSRHDAIRAIEIGIETTMEAISEGANILGTGEVGIGNTGVSSAILAALNCGDIESLTGRGAGHTDEGLSLKRSMISRALAVNNPEVTDPIDVLAKVGGFEIAGLVGVYLAAAAQRIPVVIDGFIAGAAAVVAYKINPLARDFMFASHKSEEPGSMAIAKILELEPILAMNMRLGEGTGAALAFHLIEASTAMMKSMGTFADIGM